jgi:hypothetical protein
VRGEWGHDPRYEAWVGAVDLVALRDAEISKPPCGAVFFSGTMKLLKVASIRSR